MEPELVWVAGKVIGSFFNFHHFFALTMDLLVVFLIIQT